MFKLSIESCDGYALLAVGGTAGVAEFRAAHDFMCEMVRHAPCDYLLIDMLSVSADIAPEQAPLVLEHLQATMPPFARIAIAVDPRIAHNLVMHAALARGIPVQEFDTLEAAREWLTGPLD